MVINYKEMNKATIGNAYKLSRKDSILEIIKGSNFYSSLDAKSGFWQLRLEESTKELTAFSCPPQKHYQWTVLPFGLKQAPAIYQQFMDKNLEGLEDICLAYIDDILVFTKGSKSEHLQDLIKVLERCIQKGLILSKKKAQIAKTEIDFLGLTLKEFGQISLQENCLQKISNFTNEISDRKQLQRFLGCVNYIQTSGFLKNISEITKDLKKRIVLKLNGLGLTKTVKLSKKLKFRAGLYQNCITQQTMIF